jgi:secondary thiamine-phosphate synthase enzyme
MYLTVKSGSRNELIDITPQIQKEIDAAGLREGLCLVFVPHTTAAVTINENADPSVKRDVLATLSRVFPDDPGYEHREGNSDAHVKSSLVGVSETLAIENGRLVLGTWQSVFFCEFDGPRTRKVLIRIL